MTMRSRTWFWLLCAGAGFVLSLAVPLFASGCCTCDDEIYAPASHYRIITDQSDWVMSSGSVSATPTTVLIQYETEDGSAWEVEYVVTEEF